MSRRNGKSRKIPDRFKDRALHSSPTAAKIQKQKDAPLFAQKIIQKSTNC
jgi:hypothetical protein